MAVIAWNFAETRKCPPGTVAFHSSHGPVRVLRADGWMRVIEARMRGRLVTAGGDAVFYTERLVLRIDVRELSCRPQASQTPR
jgi:hypothetical protein